MCDMQLLREVLSIQVNRGMEPETVFYTVCHYLMSEYRRLTAAIMSSCFNHTINICNIHQA